MGVIPRRKSYDVPRRMITGLPNMKRLYFLLTMLVFVTGLVGCQSRTVIGGPDAEEAAIRVEESRQEYNDCIAQRHPGAPTCDRLKALYDKDQDEYDAQVH